MRGTITVETSSGRKVAAPMHVWIFALIDILPADELEQLLKRVEQSKAEMARLAVPRDGAAAQRILRGHRG